MADDGKLDAEFYLDEADEIRWRVRADNGEIIAASTEGYKSREDAEKNAAESGFVVDGR